ncbi:MAG: crotonase/enoyl-CoA hydratase family protein [Syntrophobacteraceae bacterium]
MSDYEFYHVEKKKPVAWVYLNRPEKQNALNPPAWKEPRAIFEDLSSDADIRVVILAARGQSFCAGIDLMSMVGAIPQVMEKDQRGGTKWAFLKNIQLLQQAISSIEECQKPVIAAVHGHCIGAGLDMISACDIRLCSSDAIFSLREAAVGFVADVGVLQRLPLIVGQGITRELAYTAGNISAKRAREVLLINEVYDTREILMHEAEKMALQIAGNPPLSVQASKDVLNYCVGKSVADGLKYVASVSCNIVPSHDLTEAISAFMQKRKPEFTGK